MIKRIPRSVIAVITAISVFMLSAKYQPVFIAADEWYTTLKPQGLNYLIDLQDMVAADQDGGIVFASVGDKGYWSTPYSLIAFRLGSDGTPSAVRKVHENIQNRSMSVSGISLWDGSTTTEPPNGAAAGMVFYSFYSQKQDKATFSMARVGANGERVGDVQNLKVINAPAGQTFDHATIRATRDTETVGVAFSVVYKRAYSWPGDIARSKVFFLETDLQGKVQRGPREIKMPNGGQYRSYKVGHPAWNGANWLAPIAGITHRAVSTGPASLDTEPVENTLTVIAVKPKGKKFGIKVKQTESDKQASSSFAYDGIHFIPTLKTGNTSPTKVEKLTLLYQHKTYLKDVDMSVAAGNNDPRDYDSTFSIRQVKKNAKTKAAKSVKFPVWNPRLKAKTDDGWSYSDEWISRPAVAPNGTVFLNHGRVLEIGRAGSPPGGNVEKEGQLFLYSLNYKNGKVKQYITKEVWPTCNSMDGKTTLLLLLLALLFLGTGWGTSTAPPPGADEEHQIYFYSVDLAQFSQ